ncbi:MAG: zf-TFIIB domain-containing protein [Gammaproteobacteria bacterium]|nr:zf-TFIIB domain-containing protein [Gammaproteobacteria bacterium]
MKCPLDETQLVMTERQGIEIDYCPQCRGVWLDRGELDKIIERSSAARPPERAPERDYGRNERERFGRDSHHDRHGYRKRRKESFLSDLFDF